MKKSVLLTVFQYIVCVAISYYLLMTSLIPHSYSQWKYYVLLFFAAYFTLNLTVFWISFKKLRKIETMVHILLMPVPASLALIQNPIDLYMYYFGPLWGNFPVNSTNLIEFVTGNVPDFYFRHIFYFIIVLGLLKIAVLYFVKKEHRKIPS